MTMQWTFYPSTCLSTNITIQRCSQDWQTMLLLVGIVAEGQNCSASGAEYLKEIKWSQPYLQHHRH